MEASMQEGDVSQTILIQKSPSIVDLKQRFGVLEIDTIIGSNQKDELVAINDKLTSKVWIRKLSGKDAAPLALKTIEALQPIRI
jgi:IS30 family transposase